MKKDFYMPSSDGKTQLHGIIWKPERKIRGIFQLCHGMSEYIDRYDYFAEFLNSRGFLVLGHDHLGHGHSVYKAAKRVKGDSCRSRVKTAFTSATLM